MWSHCFFGADKDKGSEAIKKELLKARDYKVKPPWVVPRAGGAVGGAVDGAVGATMGGAVGGAMGGAMGGAVGGAMGGAVGGAVGDVAGTMDALGGAGDPFSLCIAG